MVFLRKRLEALAARLRERAIPLRIALWNGESFDLSDRPKVTIHVRTAAGLRHLVHPSLASLGRAYVEEELDVDGELASVIEIAADLARHAAQAADGAVRGIRHTRGIDAEAIAYHYDVSNDFYRLWLDENMVYSCAYFQHETDTLEQAQIHKIDHVLRKLRLRPGQRLLDIGCGWGALILRAASHHGVRATGITLSKNQYALTRERIAAAGLGDRCQVLLADYRDVDGRFDRITSIGMFEHVGLKNLEGYFAKIRDLLGNDGIVLNGGITAADAASGEAAWGSARFIDEYVFPHGELPHISLALRAMSCAGLEVVDVESLRRHYATTLKHWAQRFEQVGDRIRALAGEKRYRIWRVYLAGCAYAFEHNWTSVHHVLALKPRRPGHHPLPPTRDYMYRSDADAPVGDTA